MPPLGHRTPIETRFWKKVDRRGLDDCWEWKGSRRNGYGLIRGIDLVINSAHRVSWELHRGPIPDGLLVLHHCDNPPCTNPAHLYLGDHAANAADRERRERRTILRGEAHGMSRLTPADVRRIRALRQLGFTFVRVGALVGISKTHARDIATGASWSHLA